MRKRSVSVSVVAAGASRLAKQAHGRSAALKHRELWRVHVCVRARCPVTTRVRTNPPFSATGVGGTTRRRVAGDGGGAGVLVWVAHRPSGWSAGQLQWSVAVLGVGRADTGMG